MLIYILAYYLMIFCQLHDDPAVIWMKYDYFMTFYRLNPDKYRMDYTFGIQYDGSDHYYYIYFKNVFDYLRASRIFKRKKRSEIHSKRIKHELGYINDVKKQLREKELEESRSWEHVI